MKYYTITVNGNTYDVSVEEGARPANAPAPVAQAPKAAAPAPVAKPAAPVQEAPAAAPSGAAGSCKISSPMPGKILSIKVAIGQKVKKGDVILVLEAMKMENEIVSPQDGTVASINTSVGITIDAGNLLATLN